VFLKESLNFIVPFHAREAACEAHDSHYGEPSLAVSPIKFSPIFFDKLPSEITAVFVPGSLHYHYHRVLRTDFIGQ
jgi:hypothetical protein